jgi:hypothetical protein
MFEIRDVKDGPCPLCRGEKNRQLFVVKSPGYTGDICAPHMAVLLKQANGKKEEPTLPFAANG